MKVQSYHIKCFENGCVHITPVIRGGKGRPIRYTPETVKYNDRQAAIEGVRVTAAQANLRGL